MATFIFRFRFFSRLRVSIAGLCLLSSLDGAPAALGIGYVVSEQSRTAAAAFSQQAFAAYQGGDPARAVALTEQADRLNPDQPDTWNLRGMAYLKQRDYPRAQAAFARATALDPKLWAAQFNSAETCFQQKNYAAARPRFERLLAQTDRFKETSKWELVQYKAIVCSALLGDLAGANRKLAKLPAAGGATPARAYAQAALAFQAKNPALAQKCIAAAQGAASAEVNDLFAASLVQAGWQSLPPAFLPAPGSASGLAPLMAAAGNAVPGLSGRVRSPDSTGYIPYPVDPKLEAISDPLPVADGSRPQPVLSILSRPPQFGPAGAAPPPPSRPTPSPAASLTLAASEAAPAPTPDLGLEHGGLLLGE